MSYDVHGSSFPNVAVLDEISENVLVTYLPLDVSPNSKSRMV